MERWNSAYRLSAIASQARLSAQKEGLLVWQEAFGINAQDPRIKSLGVAVGERLVWANQELDLLEAHLRSEPDYHELYHRPIHLFRQGASPLLLGRPAHEIMNIISEDVARDFKHMIRAMERTEVKLSDADLHAFQQQLEAIRATLVEDLDERLRAIIERHLKMMQRAIDAYSVFGSRAFDDALKDSFVDLGLAHREFSGSEKETERTAVNSAVSSWQAFKDKVDTVRKTADLLLTAGKVTELILRVDHF